MQHLRSVFIAVLALCASGCASLSGSADPAIRQALAPSGKLRVAVSENPMSMMRDPVSGQTRGVTFELGRQLAERLGVPFEPVLFARPAEATEGMKAGKADLIFTNATPVRAKDIDFTPALLEIEQGYLVPAGSAVKKLADVDQPGIRVGVTMGGTSDRLLSRELKQARLVPARNLKGAIEMLSSGKIDVYATNKTQLYAMSDQLPGATLLEGRYGVELIALGIPRGREQGMDYLRQFAAEMKSSGFVQEAVGRAGLRGLAVAK